MATLEANFADLREMHDSISRFNENFAAFLYGLNLNAYCVDFPEAPVGPESFARVARKEAESARESEGEALFGFAGATPSRREYDVETTFMWVVLEERGLWIRLIRRCIGLRIRRLCMNRRLPKRPAHRRHRRGDRRL
jgi:hypothetical protein